MNKICPHCQQEIRPCNFTRHVNSHVNGTYKAGTGYHLDHDGLNCKFCQKLCRNTNALRQHELRCKQNPDKLALPTISGDHFAEYRKTHGSWNKGLTKETDTRIVKYIEARPKYNPNGWKGRKHTEETKQKLSKALLEYNHGDNQRNLHSKGGWFDGIYFMSTWELAYYIYQRDRGILLSRCEERFQYIWEGKLHYYTPDFLIKDEYIEIKGKEWPKDLIKYQAVKDQGKQFKVLYEKDLKDCFDYVLTTYNVQAIKELYESR
jgi:hypothetical protein